MRRNPLDISSRSDSVNASFERRPTPCLIAIHSIIPFNDKVLRPPVESADSRHSGNVDRTPATSVPSLEAGLAVSHIDQATINSRSSLAAK
jgi:hypothetical protein